MRTTVEIPDKQRAKLLELAARRAEKGFSGLVQEALELYFRQEDERQRKIQGALSVLGTLEKKSAREMRQSIKAVRERWR